MAPGIELETPNFQECFRSLPLYQLGNKAFLEEFGKGPFKKSANYKKQKKLHRDNSPGEAFGVLLRIARSDYWQALVALTKFRLSSMVQTSLFPPFKPAAVAVAVKAVLLVPVTA